MEGEKVDALVVGAGPSGSIAAYHLAKAGLQVIQIERGAYAGAKNVSGARLYGYVLPQVLPDGVWKEAPLERCITKEKLVFMTEKGTVAIEFHHKDFENEPCNSYTVIRAKFDKWLAERAEEAGVLLATGINVDELVIENGRVTGINAGGEIMKADAVILAEGALGLLAEKHGFRKMPQPSDVAVGVKEVWSLPKEQINDRFGLDDGEGAVLHLVGFPSKYLRGGAFLYTMESVISMGIVLQMDSVPQLGKDLEEVIEDFRLHPYIFPLVQGAQLVEYSAKTVPERFKLVDKFYAPGVLLTGDTAGFLFNLGFTIRGIDLAMLSGKIAAETILELKKKGDLSPQSFALYEKKIKESIIWRDYKVFKNAHKYLRDERIYSEYPELIIRLVKRIFEYNGTRAETVYQAIRRELSMLKLLKLGLHGMKGAKSL
ncbi:MAG: FAD-dependent oxidoreductase [Candidatus Njordarchaeia archaeon]